MAAEITKQKGTEAKYDMTVKDAATQTEALSVILAFLEQAKPAELTLVLDRSAEILKGLYKVAAFAPEIEARGYLVDKSPRGDKEVVLSFVNKDAVPTEDEDEIVLGVG